MAVFALAVTACYFKPDGEQTKAPPAAAHETPTVYAASPPPTGEAPAAATATTPPPGSAVNPANDSAKLAQGITISEVAVFQGVRVSIAKDGQKVTSRNMPLIAGRDAAIRVFVTPGSGFTARSLSAELRLVADGKILGSARDTKSIGAASNDADGESTLNFVVPGAMLPANVQYNVRLLDDAAPVVPVTQASNAQYPTNGSFDALEAMAGADRLKIVLVPVLYGADGSNRSPNVSGAMVETLRQRTLELYPVPSVDITVHSPMTYTGQITAMGGGWDNVLAEITQLRMMEHPPADTYYYGAFAPAPTMAQYCGTACVLGLSNLDSSPTDATNRAAIGVLYDDVNAIGTLPHELGHAHGRQHAPCGSVANPDPNFPYPNAQIGVWGYSIITKMLLNPAASTKPHDFMSYCGPAWTSDYTFKALFDRGRMLKTASIHSAAPKVRPLRFLFQRPSGLAWNDRPPFVAEQPLGGEPRAITFLAADGTVLGEDTANFYGYDHLDGGHFIVPEGPLGTARISIAGAGEIAVP